MLKRYIDKVLYIIMKNIIVTFLLIGYVFSPAVRAEDISASIQATQSGFSINRATGIYKGSITLENNSNYTLTNLRTSLLGINKDQDVLNFNDYDENLNPIVLANLKFGVLLPGQKISIPLEIWNPKKKSIIYTTKTEADIFKDNNSKKITVKVYKASDDENVSQSVLAGPGVEIHTLGVLRAVTDESSKATFTVLSDLQEISAYLGDSFSGKKHIDLEEGNLDSFDLTIRESDRFHNALIQIDQVRKSTLSRDPSELSISLIDYDYSNIVLKNISRVELFDESGEQLADVTEMFNIKTNGGIYCINLPAFNTIIQDYHEKIRLSIEGRSVQNKVYSGDSSFLIGENILNGTLRRPPSNSTLMISGATVYAKVSRSNIIYTTTTDNNGKFTFQNLPRRPVTINTEILENSQYYYGTIVTDVLNQSNEIDLPLENQKDLVDKVEEPQEEIQNENGNLKKTISKSSNNSTENIEDTLKKFTIKMHENYTETVSISVPKGTKFVNVTYRTFGDSRIGIATGYSPNHKWKLSLFNGTTGKRLWFLARDLLSQLTERPLFIAQEYDFGVANSSDIIDVSEETKNGDAVIRLSGIILPPREIDHTELHIKASISLGAPFSIKSIKPSRVTYPIIHANRGDRFSIPFLNDANTFQRYFDLNVINPKNLKIKNVKVELSGPSIPTVEIDTITPGRDLIIQNNELLKVRSTFRSNNTFISSVPPPKEEMIFYRFTITATDSNGEDQTAEIDSQRFYPLWRMPDGFERYSVREDGFDDWVSGRMYYWMESHKADLKAINDASGEHGKDLQHSSHTEGTDIDMHHFYVFPGYNGLGTRNYQGLLENIKIIPKINSTNQEEKLKGEAAKEKVKSWIVTSRAGIDKFSAMYEVTQVGYILSGPNATFTSSATWGRDLLQTGKIKINGVEYDMGTGLWSNIKYKAWEGHHHHVHLTVKPN